MPSVFAEPTLQELLDAFKDGVRAKRDKHADGHEGAVYEHFAGPAAILWSRAARRTTDVWRAIYFDSAEANELTHLLDARYSFERIPDAYGLGTATLKRATSAASSGTIWAGTRITTYGVTVANPKRYVVTADVAVSSTALTASVSVRAELPGPGTGIDLGGTLAARVDDPLWDTTWTVDRLTCADGTSFEPAPVARARFRDQRIASRPGYVEEIIQACKDAGAGTAYLFPSDYAGETEDFGLNRVYVGDAGYQGSAALSLAVTIALESHRVLGDNLQVGALGLSDAIIKARVYLWDGVLRTNEADTRSRLNGALLGYFDRVYNFGYQRDALAGAMLKAAPAVQYVEFDEPTSDADIVSLVNGRMNFPTTLNLYRLAPNDISLTLLPAI